MRHDALATEHCAIARSLAVLGERWTFVILRSAFTGARRFEDYQSSTGIARNILTDRLRKLTAHGLLAQRTASTGRRQEYVLTDAGRDLFPVILTLRQWGERHAFASGETHSTLVDQHGTPVPEIAPTGADGTLLGIDSTHVQKTR